MNGPAYDDAWRIETEHIDSTGGMSGGPWWRMFDIDRPVAVNMGWRTYFDFGRCGFDFCRRNFGRKIDGAVSQFIIDNSWDY